MSTSSHPPTRPIWPLTQLGYHVLPTTTDTDNAYAVIYPAYRAGEASQVIARLNVSIPEPWSRERGDKKTLLVYALHLERDPRSPAARGGGGGGGGGGGRPLPSDVLLSFWLFHMGRAWFELERIVFTEVREPRLCDMVPSLYRNHERGRSDTLGAALVTGAPGVPGRGDGRGDGGGGGGGDPLGNAIATTLLGGAAVDIVTGYGRQPAREIIGFRITPVIHLPAYRQKKRMRADQQLVGEDIIGNFHLEVFIGDSWGSSSCSAG